VQEMLENSIAILFIIICLADVSECGAVICSAMRHNHPIRLLAVPAVLEE